MSITVTSSAFMNGQQIPTKYTGDGADVSPPIKWSQLPEGTKEVALICDDPDAPTPKPWVHWVIYGISPEVEELPEHIPAMPEVKRPIEARQGKNSWDAVGYRGPAPPRGHGVHHYYFKVYALDTELKLKPSASKEALLDIMEGHILAQGQLVGTYER